MTNCNEQHVLMLTCPCDVDVFTRGHITLSLLKRVHVDWNWPISREKYLKIDCFENAVAVVYLRELQTPSNGLLLQFNN